MDIDVTQVAKIDARRSEGLKNIISKSGSLQMFAGANDCRFFVNNTTNPASIANPATKGGDLEITISSWFLKGYSVGYVMGMLCHEVGAHYMADEGIGDKAYANEATTLKNKMKIADPLTKWSYVPVEASQSDHIFACCYGSPRYDYYRNLMGEFATLISMYLTVPVNGKLLYTDEDLPDLLDCWLMDVASILATKDRRHLGVVYPYSKYVAEAYSAHLAQLKADAATVSSDADVQTAIAGLKDKTASEVMSAYGSMAKKLFA